MPTEEPAAAKKDAEMGAVVAAGEHIAAGAVWAMMLGCPGMLGMELSQGPRAVPYVVGFISSKRGLLQC